MKSDDLKPNLDLIKVGSDKHSFTINELEESSHFKATGEFSIISHLIKSKLILPNSVIIDIGANIGEWTKQFLKFEKDVDIHLFEPAPYTYNSLLKNLAEQIKSGRLFLNNFAIGQKEEIRAFHYYKNSPSWSTFYRRYKVEKEYNLQSPKRVPVYTTTLDDYCERLEIKNICFLKIDVEGAEFDVLKGTRRLLEKGRIDHVQFEYDGTYYDAGIKLEQIFEILANYNYLIFKILPNGLEYKPEFLPIFEDYTYANYLAVNERLRSIFLKEKPKMLDLKQLCEKHSISPKGVIHIGAHEGGEIDNYLAMGVNKVLFVEANPTVFKRLEEKVGKIPNVQAVNCAISDKCGSVTLHVTSMDQSSSILPLKHHKEIYPDIKETHQVIVSTKTLDILMSELNLSPAEFNILNIDIQGAELLAFQGSSDTLKYIEAINTEVNYQELYEGCALIDQIDAFLGKHGFDRSETTTPFHPSWGDAFYTKRPVVTMSTLGENGRFANQVFQYAFLKIYAKEHNLRVEMPEWIGNYLFGHDDPPISRQFPVVRQETYKLSEDPIPNAKRPFKNADFWGYFQYATKYYAPHKKYFRSLFKPVPGIEKKLEEALISLRQKGKTVIGMHIRRGDYGYGHFFIAPNKWYQEWVAGLWETLDDPVLFIASDQPQEVVGDFAEYNPITARELGIMLPEADFYPDFYLLTQCDVVAISNSSFSFAACMLNERAKIFSRPHLYAKKLIPFDPWNSEVIFRDAKVEDCVADEKTEVPTKSAGKISLPCWLPPKDQIEKLMTEFLKLYDARPIKNNDGGVKSVGAFSLWFFLRRIKPSLVIESGVWKGLTTWVIEKSVPEANLICLDPQPEIRQYTSENASYPAMDFADMDFGDKDLSKALVFFDDHQNAYKRVLQACEKGFTHLIFDDNYPITNDSHLTLQSCLSLGEKEARHLQEIIEKYEVFPPFYQYNKPVTAEKILIDVPSLNISDTPEFQILKQEMSTYRWMTYVKLVAHLRKKYVSQAFSYLSEKCSSESKKDVKTDLEVTPCCEKNDSSCFPSINLVLCFLSPRNAYREVMISKEEVFCGPDCNTTIDGDKYRTINTPAGVYDIRPIIDRLSESQKPELLVVKADATARNFPVNLSALRCPKVLVLGNTQHLYTPIRALLKYALEEKFDFILSDHKRHHLHYFKEAGFNNIYWIPALNISPHEQPYYSDKSYNVSFVGQAGRFHPFRKYILEYLKTNKINVDHFQIPPDKAAEIYAQSLINLNVSLNGDLNLRVFEVLSSGGFLITDKLSEESGLDLLFKDGEHLVCFKNEKDLIQKIRYFLTHPEEAKNIAKSGYQEFVRKHTPEKKIKELMDFVFKGEVDPLYEIQKDKRSVYVKSDNSSDLMQRIALYEHFQEMHLKHIELSILFWPGVDPRLICDMVDLPRLQIFIMNDCGKIPEKKIDLFHDTNVAERIFYINEFELQQTNSTLDAIVITASELINAGLYNTLMQVNFKVLVISDGIASLEEEQREEIKKDLTLAGFDKNSDEIDSYFWRDKSTFLLNKGIAELNSNNNENAFYIFNKAISRNPDIPGIAYGKAIALARLGRREAAVKALNQLLTAIPEHKKAEFLLNELVGQ